MRQLDESMFRFPWERKSRKDQIKGNWPVPGSEDTELGVFMGPGAVMERRRFTREFKLEAVRLIRDRGVSYAQASQDLNVHPTQLRSWVKAFADDPQQAVVRAPEE